LRIPADRRSLGDRLGRWTIYLIGIAWFALTSAACGFIPDVVFLIITRALLTPRSLAIWQRRSGPPTAAGQSAPGQAWAASLSRRAARRRLREIGSVVFRSRESP
jgi:MFS family permease